jgi:hypothetical protein
VHRCRWLPAITRYPVRTGGTERDPPAHLLLVVAVAQRRGLGLAGTAVEVVAVWILAMTVRIVVRLCGVMALLVLGGCGQREPSSAAERTGDAVPGWTAHTDADHGYRISFPDSWHRATERMSRIGEPRELFSLATVPLSWHDTDCEAFAGAAGVSMGRGDVVVTVWERGYDPDSDWLDFPPRPQHFGPVPDAEPAGPGCGEPSGTMIHWRNFSDSGRHLHTLVRLGPEAPTRAAAEAWQILDSLRLDPDYRPSWPASG